VAGSAQAAPNPDCPWVGSPAPIGSRVQQVLARMSLDDEIALVHGTGGSAYTGFVPGNDTLCIRR
jgi:beta-glucosidase